MDWAYVGRFLGYNLCALVLFGVQSYFLLKLWGIAK